MLPSSDSTGAFHFESVNARLDNIGGSPWLNIRLGKFELNNLLSEKRTLWLTGNGGVYQTYHFIPVGDGNTFGQMGDNQLGVKYMGHSIDDRTRISAALLSSNDGSPGLITGANSYSGFFTLTKRLTRASWGWSVRSLRFVGDAATYYLTDSSGGTGAVPIRFRELATRDLVVSASTEIL